MHRHFAGEAQLRLQLAQRFRVGRGERQIDGRGHAGHRAARFATDGHVDDSPGDARLHEARDDLLEAGEVAGQMRADVAELPVH